MTTKIEAATRLLVSAAASDELKAAATHMRDFMKQKGIKARLKMWPPDNFVVYTTGPTIEWTPEEQKTIRTEAKRLGLTWVRGLEIDPNRMTNPHSMAFYIWKK